MLFRSQAAEGGVVAAEYQEHFGDHAFDDEGNYIGGTDPAVEEAWAEYYAEYGDGTGGEATPSAEPTAEGGEATDEGGEATAEVD